MLNRVRDTIVTTSDRERYILVPSADIEDLPRIGGYRCVSDFPAFGHDSLIEQAEQFGALQLLAIRMQEAEVGHFGLRGPPGSHDELFVEGDCAETYLVVDAQDVLRFFKDGASRFVEAIVAGQDERDGRDATADLADLAKCLASGEWVAVRLSPLPPRLDPASSRWLFGGADTPRDGPVLPAPARPTWLSLELVHEAGIPTAGSSVRVVTPDGEVRNGVLDARSRWRADDILQSGACVVTLGSGLPKGPRGAATVVTNTDVWLGSSEASVRLNTDRHHRVVIVGGSTQVVLLDHNQAPVANERCRVVVAQGRELMGLTNSAGGYVARHPASAIVRSIDFPNYDGSRCRPS